MSKKKKKSTKKKTDVKPVITKVNILQRSDSHCTEEGDGQKWGQRDCYAYSHTFHGIKVMGENEYSDVEVGFPIEADKTYWLLYGTYQSGDSFGSDTGNLHIVDLYQNKYTADCNVKALRDSYEDYKKTHKIKLATLKMDNGDTITHYVPWCGYFERLEFLEVLPVSLNQIDRYYVD